LECTWAAFENAGIAPTTLNKSNTGVFIGISSHDYQLAQLKESQPEDISKYFGTGSSPATAAGTFGLCKNDLFAIYHLITTFIN